MRQLNLNVTEEFERDLRRFMRQKGITKQSEAIRLALREAVAKAGAAFYSDYRSWLGLGLVVDTSTEISGVAILR
jgi:hypothetical protein